MTYDAFLESLPKSGWAVPNRSFAHRELDGGWQISFVRFGGKFQLPGRVTFVICVRHKCLRNVKREVTPIEKDPTSYPFKFTLQEIELGELTYQGKAGYYEHSELGVSDEWERVLLAL